MTYDHVGQISHVTTVSSSYDQVRQQIHESLVSLGVNLAKLERGEISKVGTESAPTHTFSALSSQMSKLATNIIETVSFSKMDNFIS